MDPLRVINDVFGKPALKSFPNQEEVDVLPKLPDGEPDFQQLPKETVGNVLMVILSKYPVSDPKKVFYPAIVANLIVTSPEGQLVELQEKFKKFLISAVEWAIIKEEKNERKEATRNGIYYSWVCAQVLQELGVENKED